MKRYIIGVVAVGLLVSACGGGGEPAVVTVTETPTTTEAPATSESSALRRGELLPEDRAFLSTLDEYWTDSVPNADLIEMGTTICAKLDAGADMMDVLEVVVSQPDIQNEGISLLHSSVVAYCPQYLTGIK